MFVTKCFRIALECVPRNENQQDKYLNCSSISMIGRSVQTYLLSWMKFWGLQFIDWFASCYSIMLTCPHLNPDFVAQGLKQLMVLHAIRNVNQTGGVPHPTLSRRQNGVPIGHKHVVYSLSNRGLWQFSWLMLFTSDSPNAWFICEVHVCI